MILSDGTDTREEVRTTHGKYQDGMTVVLECLSGNGFADDYLGIPDTGEGCERFGRRVFWWTSTGFLGSSRHASEEDALRAMWEAYPDDVED